MHAIPRAHTVLLSLILVLAACVRVWGSTFGLPHGDARPDEMTMVLTSLGLLFGGLNPRFFHWPSLEFYVLAALYRAAFEVAHFLGVFHLKFDMFRDAMVNPGPYLLVPRTVSAAAGVLTVWLVYRITRELLDRTTALVAAFFLAVAYLHVRDSHFGVTDVPMTALAMCSLLCLHRAAGAPTRLGRWALAGVMAGLTASTKYSGAVLAAAGLVAATIVAPVRDEPWSGRNAARRATTFLACALLGFIAGTPYAVLAYPAFVEGVRFESHHLAAGHGIQLGYGWIYHLMFTLRYGLGTPLLIASIAGIPVLAATSWRKGALVCTFPVLYYLLLGRGTTVFVRYMIPIVPFMCITAAVSVVALANRLSPRSRQTGALISAAVAVLLALPSIQRVLAFDSLLTETDTRVLAARWLDTHTQSSEWVSETPDRILHPTQQGLRIARFDAARQLFVSEKNDVVTPEWIVVATSPLTVYTTVPAALLPILESSYSAVATFSSARGPESSRAFDQQDKFFLPYAEFKARLRPGPDIRIYHRFARPLSPMTERASIGGGAQALAIRQRGRILGPR
jgi:hypothetical protein